MAAKKRVNEDEDQDISIRPMHNSAEKKLAVPDDLEKPPPDDRSTVFIEKQRGSWPKNIEKKLSLLLIPCALVIIALLGALNIPTAFEPPLILPLMNTLFLGIIPIVIAYVTFKVYKKSGSVSVLLIGSGVLLFGLGSIVAGWVNPLIGGPNMTVTIHNTCACIGSILILTGAVMSQAPAKSGRVTGNAGTIATVYAGIVIFVTIFSLATLQGMIPTFFVPGYGPTVLRQVILENATILFALSSVLFMVAYRKGRSDYFFWYSVALALIATGLLAVFVQPSVGSLIGWVGRSAQYIGFVFALYAVLIARKTATAKGLPLEDVIGSFFVDAEQNYRQLVETATDAIVTIDDNCRVLLWNSAAERMFGYPRDDAIGASFLKLGIDDPYRAVIKNYDKDIFGRDISALTLEPVEIVAKHKDGAFFPVELTVSRRWQEGRLIQTCILRDITERKRAEEELFKTNEELAVKSEELKTQFDALAKSERITRLSEERLILAQEIGHTGSWEYNVQTGKIWGSAEGLHIYGFHQVAGEIPLDNIEACIPERERVHQALTDIITKGTEYDIEFAISPADGSAQKIIRSIARLEKDEQGNPLKVVGAIHDITDLQQIEALRESEVSYRGLFNTLRQAIYILNPDGTFIDVNEGAVAMYGYARQEFIGRTPEFLSAPGKNDLAAVMEYIKKAFAGESQLFEFWGLRKGGEHFPKDVYLYKGTYFGKGVVIAVGSDLTERKKAEAALRESHDRFEATIASLDDAVFLVNPATRRIGECNTAATRIFGYSHEELVGRDTSFLHVDQMHVEQFGREAMATYEEPGYYLREFEMRRKDGCVFPTEHFVRPIRNPDGRILYVVSVVRDISKRKRAEDALRLSEEKFRLISESSPDHIIIQDRDLRYIWVLNPQLGLTCDDMIGKTDYDILLKEDADKLTLVKRQVLETGKTIPYETSLSFSQGETEYFEGVYLPKYDSEGKIDGVMGYFRNITERKQAERTIRHALAEKEVLLREVHHRVKNSLAGILSLIELQISSLSDPQQIAQFKDLETRIRSMALVHDTLTRTKDLARINVATYTENLTRHLLPAYGTANEVRCRIEMGDFTLPIETATPCGLVMNEIITNSLKYAFPTTFSCEEVRGEPCTITLTLHREGNDYLLGIADNGIGMPEGIDDTMAHTLGRFLIRFIVEHQLGGSIEISTARGTAYTIRFPAPAVNEGNTYEKM